MVHWIKKFVKYYLFKINILNKISIDMCINIILFR